MTWRKVQKFPERMTDGKELGVFSTGKMGEAFSVGKSLSMKQAVRSV